MRCQIILAHRSFTMSNWKICGVMSLFLSLAIFVVFEAPAVNAADLVVMGSPQTPPPPPGQRGNINQPVPAGGLQGAPGQGPAPGIGNPPAPQGVPPQPSPPDN